MKNLSSQFTSGINSKFKPGQNKHALKHQDGLGTGTIFSYADRKNLIDASFNLTNYLKEKYPNVKLIYQITHQQVQEFLNEKAKTCTVATLKNFMAQFKKLDKITSEVYRIKTCLGDEYSIPIAADETAKRRALAMDDLDYEMVLKEMKTSSSRAKNAIELAGRFGLRVSETTKLQKRDIDLKNGCIHIIDSKGGRNRDIPISTKDRNFCEQLRELVKEDKGRIVPLLPDSVNKYLSRCLQSIGITKYKHATTGIHAIRKMFAQNYYNDCRNNGDSTKVSLQKTSEVLGHGKERYELMREYIAEIK